MTRTKIIVVLVVALAALAYVAMRAWSAKESTDRYRTAPVERGDITAIVSASGTVNPVTQVQVGTQVSGQIRELAADFNSEVKKGQVLARIDPDPYELRIRQASADLEAARATALAQLSSVAAMGAEVMRAQAGADQARRDWERKRSLVARNFISAAELDTAQSTLDGARAQLQAAQAQLRAAQAQIRNTSAAIRQREAQLEQAKVDLEKTYVRSPVDGIVIKRSVERGQTVAASLQTPELFVIAKNLIEMQVEASIDEADIGRIQIGQQASFTVDAFPGRTFQGEVAQIRKAPAVQQNVVTYTVVIRTANERLELLPGMTTTVKISIDTHQDVLKVPSAALRFQPAGQERGERERKTGARGDGARRGAPRVWVLDGTDQPRAIEVKTGLTDGTMTEIETDQIRAGSAVIVSGAEPAAKPRTQGSPRLPF